MQGFGDNDCVSKVLPSTQSGIRIRRTRKIPKKRFDLENFMQLIAVAVGGAIGAILRFVISGVAYAQFGVGFPVGTFLVNMIGCFLIGFLAQLFEEMIVPPNMRLLILTGTLGALTTFSTYGLETVKLWQGGELRLALINIVASNLIGILFVVLGFILARALLAALR